MPPETTNQELKSAIEKNSKLLNENNELLKKIHRNGLWGFWLRIAWYLLLIGIPFVLYFYVVEPYFELMGANYETFKAGLSEIPGLRGLEQLLDKLGEKEL